MATALIPLIAGLAPDLISLIVSLIHPKAIAAESLGQGNGALKFADVFVSVMSDLAKAHAAGSIVGPLPDDATVKLILQSVVLSLKLTGVLTGGAVPPAPVPPASAQSIALKAGQSLLVTA